MAVQQKLMTVEEFWEQYAGKPYELIHGEVVERVATGYLHGVVVSLAVEHLSVFVRKTNLGQVVTGETGFWLAPEVMRAADAAFVGNKKLATITEPEKYLPFPPDLAVEVVSPNDTATDIQQKVDLYLKAGTSLVWVIYPDLRKVVVYQADGRSKPVSAGDELDGGEVLPGLKIPVLELFPLVKGLED